MNDWDSPRLQECLHEYEHSTDPGAEIAARYGVGLRTLTAIAYKRGIRRKRDRRRWPPEAIAAALRAFAGRHPGPLPSGARLWNRVCTGDRTMPSSATVLTNFGSMGRAWQAAGVDPMRWTLGHSEWTKAEEEFLLDRADSLTLDQMARQLHRTYAAVKDRLNRTLGVKARENQGYLTAQRLAQELQCPYSRVCKLLRSGGLPGTYVPRLHRWHIDPTDLTPEIARLLREPKRTHQRSPTDMGDYERRHGLIRKTVGGRAVRMKVAA